ncbi:ATP-dependent RNA helicase SUPV3L1, mitochondrial-like isoform X2 [Dysidea avara]
MIKSALKTFNKDVLQQFPTIDINLSSVLFDIHNKKRSIDDLFPFFLDCAKSIYPDELCEELLSNNKLSCPPLWYLRTRKLKRRFVYHAGPTNSGKTHAALERYMSAEKAVYCAPLRMLAAEIYQRCNAKGVLCDMLTGEEQLFGSGSPDEPANHLSCTVEMADCSGYEIYDVAVIDEAQMIGNSERGFAWTRVLLGLPAKEIHLCGSKIAVDVVKKIVTSIGEEIEVKYYDRLLPLVTLKDSLGGEFSKLRPGDCLVAFSRNNIFQLKALVEQYTGYHCAVVYGGLPSVMRLKQAAMFNDKLSPVMVASDAIGMGLNLNIRRIVFYSVEKFSEGEKSILSSVDAKQIAGRAGRYQSQYDHGEVTTFFPKHMPILKKLLSQKDNNIKQAGISVSLELLEEFAKEFPQTPMHQLLKVFENVHQFDNNYFLCNGKLDEQKEISYALRNMGLSLEDLYMFSLAPVNYNSFVCTEALHMFARCYSEGKPVTGGLLRKAIGWPLPSVTAVAGLKLHELAHEITDLYLWLHMRRPEMFIHPGTARVLQQHLVSTMNQSLLPHSKSHRKRHRHRHN